MQINSKMFFAVSFLALALMAGGCTRSQKNVEVAKREGAQGPGASGQQQQQVVPGNGSTSIVIPEETIQVFTSSRENLSYRFEYLNVKDEKALNLVDGKATITVGSLPVDQVGTAKLEILENGAVKARGETVNVKLTLAGPNNIDITLKPVTNGVTTPGTTNAVISVTLPGTTPSITPSPIIQPSVSPSTIPTPTTWDGSADRGNEKWKIETVTQ